MPFISKSLSQLIAETQADIESRLPGSYTRVAEKTLNALAFGMGGVASGLQAQIEWLSHQVIPTESDPEKLAEWCNAFNVPRKLSSAAGGALPITTTQALTIDAGTRWQRPDGVTFEVVTATSCDGAGELNIPMRAIESGASGNTPAHVKFSIVTPQAGVQSSAMSTSAMTGGADIESLTRWRARLLFRMQYPPAGGTKYDYERWALECAGVTRAWCYKGWRGADVGVTFVMDDNTPIIPTSADVTTVARYISGHRDPVTNTWVGQPLGPEVMVFAPTPVTVDISVMIVPATDDIKSNVEAAINQFFRSSVTPGQRLYRSELEAAISNATGVIDRQLVEPAGDVYCDAGQLLMLGDITWL